VGIRVGICAGLSHSTSGYHVTGTAGTLGAGAAAARLLRLPADRAAHALGIAATPAAGLYAARTGAMTNAFTPGAPLKAASLRPISRREGSPAASTLWKHRSVGS
jgi:2-methylcitrate dehydratase PrpD